MKNHTKILLLLFCAFILLAGFQSKALEFYVATNGNDSNPGSKAKPFATLQKARDAARATENKEPIEIIIREGIYELEEILMLKPEDSGTEEAPIIWRAAENEKVIISGGKTIRGKWETKDGKTWFVDLPTVKEGDWNFRQLFVNGKRITRARFPNISEPNPFLYAEGGTISSIQIKKRLIKKSWGEASDAQINIVPKWKFFNQWNTVKSVDKKTGTIHLKEGELHAEIIKGNWFWIEGVREELDEPGEWFLDKTSGRLYYMPEEGIDPNKQNIVAPRLNTLIYAKGDPEKNTHVKHIRFKNLEFKHTRFTLNQMEPRVATDAAVLFENTGNSEIKNCRFDNIGGYALWLHLDSKENIFTGNTVSNSGGGGVLLTGARFSYMDESRLYTPGEKAARVFPILNRITHNTVKHCGKIRYYGGGVHLDSRPDNMCMAPGNYIAHNYFYDLSRNGIFAFRNQGGNVVEYNHIHDAMQTTIDGACIHFATMNHLNAPNYILNNYLHDIWGYEQKPNGKPERHLANGIFLDWATSNTTVRDNYIYNAGGEAIKNIMGNWNLTIENNKISEQRIVPPFLKELGPGKKATNEINLESNSLIGSVVHYTNKELVGYTGDWKPRKIDGFWNLFSFSLLEVETGNDAEISYTLPIKEDGIYQVSILYLPDEKNADNAKIKVHHANGISEVSWNMKEGDKFGFALEIGKYAFEKGKAAKVSISNSGANGVVVANSVAFVKTEDK